MSDAVGALAFPHVPSHWVSPALAPRSGPAQLVRALAVGWVPVITAARGPVVTTELRQNPGTGKRQRTDVVRVVDSLAVRLGHPTGARAVGVWHDGRWDEGWTWTCDTDTGRALTWPVQINNRDLRAAVATVPVLGADGDWRTRT